MKKESLATPSGPTIPTTGHLSLETKNRLKSKKFRKKGVAKEKAKKQRIDPKCWKGYRKSGTQVKGGIRVNKCVKIGEAWESEMANLIILLENK